MSKLLNPPKGAQYYGKETRNNYAAWYKKEGDSWLAWLCGDNEDHWSEVPMSKQRLAELVKIESSQVRPRISRENYAWLKSIHGKNNDERFSNLRSDVTNSHYKISTLRAKIDNNDGLIENLRNEIIDFDRKESKLRAELNSANNELKLSAITIKSLASNLKTEGNEKNRMKSERDTFIAYLCVSMAVNFGLLGYVATLQGWF